MSVELHDLAARLRAATAGHPTPRTTYAHVLPPLAPLLVSTRTDGQHLHLAASTGDQHAQGADRDALSALATLGAGTGAGPDQHPRTLVVATREDLRALLALADTHARTGALAPVGATLDWWGQRAEHPTSRATLVLTDALRGRYAAAHSPDLDGDLDAWARAFHLPDTAPGTRARLAVLDALARLATTGIPLPGLDEAAQADTRSWDWRTEQTAAGRPWHLPDDRRAAALGLATRSHAREHHDALRRADPRVAAREALTGTVVAATITDLDAATMTVRAHQPLSRLRTGHDVTGWLGLPEDVATDAAAANRIASATITATTIDPSGDLHITLSSPRLRQEDNALRVGASITLAPSPPDPRAQANARTNMRTRYTRTDNWLATGARPTARRRDVPLDVVVAAAE
ncbi:hypothetical protein [uncultured Pseudokineococcus sp.]|uniref:hypothetical protein n=1 Tax=uncultured Pseudokineococcus sp. TaxID=1642928 RepID=UPI00261C84F9|nr:hypothetical protein [uncultured Pseudokineococcus sp.]